jgi:DeoR/GlpR family transcriptional regulator of sugar metabolism
LDDSSEREQMLAAQRQATILKVIVDQGAARISDLAEILGVSEMTVRRDLDLLADEGALEKVHGGATSLSPSATLEPPFLATNLRELEAKKAIGKHAAKFVSPGSAVALLGGSTVFALAKELTSVEGLTVVTNSVPISDLFQREKSAAQSIILVGGSRTPTDSLVGPVAIDTFSKFNFDLVVVGTHGMDAPSGFSSPNLLEAETNMSVVKHSNTFMVLADYSKWGLRGFATFARLEEAEVVVSDSRLSISAQSELSSRVGTLELVELTESDNN